MGIQRPEVTSRPVRFFSSGLNWIIYEPGDPLLIHRVFPERDFLVAILYARTQFHSPKADVFEDVIRKKRAIGFEMKPIARPVLGRRLKTLSELSKIGAPHKAAA